MQYVYVQSGPKKGDWLLGAMSPKGCESCLLKVVSSLAQTSIYLNIRDNDIAVSCLELHVAPAILPSITALEIAPYTVNYTLTVM